MHDVFHVVLSRAPYFTFVNILSCLDLSSESIGALAFYQAIILCDLFRVMQ